MKSIELTDGWLLRLDPDEELIQSLRHFAQENSINFAAVTSAVGMLKNAKLGFFVKLKMNMMFFT